MVIAFAFLDGFGESLRPMLLSVDTRASVQQIQALYQLSVLVNGALFLLTQLLFFLVALRVVGNWIEWVERPVPILRPTFVYAWLGATIYLAASLTAFYVVPSITTVEFHRQTAQAILANFTEFPLSIPLGLVMTMFRYFLLLLAAFALVFLKKWRGSVDQPSPERGVSGSVEG